MRPGGSKIKGGVYWGEEEGANILQSVSVCGNNVMWAVHWVISYRFGQHFSLSGDHTETIELTFDPRVTTYSRMLELFWENHDPTRCASRQYMSAVFYHDETQRKLAEAGLAERQKQLSKKIVTKIAKAETFYDAEK